MPSKTVSIKNFLSAVTHKDLSELYNYGMEVQVNVAQDNGERIDGDYQGRKWVGWTDGVTTWKSFRIPFKANTEPYYEDTILKFDLESHAEAIGMTGWDWENRCSKWVAFDFDSIVNHKASGLSNQELANIQNAAYDIPWVTIRKSTSGTGIHLYVFLDDFPTRNHNEHAALARSILGVMSAITGYDFHSKIDVCGGNMWVWHRKMKGTDGLSLVKEGIRIPDDEVPVNWKDHIKVISGSRRKNLPQKIKEVGKDDVFEELTGQRQFIDLDEDHKRLIEFLRENDYVWWWDQDHHMLVTHTYHLQQAHEELELDGIFVTNSQGNNLNEQNCYAFPMRKGAWVVRRFTPGVNEHSSWNQDGAGWTRCYLNRVPDLKTACRAYGGLEDSKGRFQFQEAEVAVKALESIGVKLNLQKKQLYRKATIHQHRDGRIMVTIARESQDSSDEMPGWLAEKNTEWMRIFNSHTTTTTHNEPEVGNYDDIVRHIVSVTGEDSGWMIRSDGEWRLEPLNHVKAALNSVGFSTKDTTSIVGSSVMKAWKLVNKPFQGEYPGNREWNRNAAQLRYVPLQNADSLHYPHWRKILEHCGAGLDEAIKENGWAKANGILSGADYLKCWIASVFQHPTEPLPYLFFYSQEQDTGKSIFHESLSSLITRGYQRADIALSESTDFNGELEGAIICVIEETDLHHNKRALNRIKDWVTSKQLNIRHMYRTPYHITNTTHWIQCSNEHQACPIFPGDTRITMCHVKPLEPWEMIPKKKMLAALEKEAQHFVTAIMTLELPAPIDRLNIPVINTEDKRLVEKMNQSQLQQFIEEKCVYLEGHMIKYSDFYDHFEQWVEPEQKRYWTKNRMSREFPPQYPRARVRKDGQFHIGNIAWRSQSEELEQTTKLVVHGDYLEPAE